MLHHSISACCANLYKYKYYLAAQRDSELFELQLLFDVGVFSVFIFFDIHFKLSAELETRSEDSQLVAICIKRNLSLYVRAETQMLEES